MFGSIESSTAITITATNDRWRERAPCIRVSFRVVHSTIAGRRRALRRYAKWRPWSEQAVGDAFVTGSVGVNPVIYAETSLAFADANALDRHLNDLLIMRLPLPLRRCLPGGEGLFPVPPCGWCTLLAPAGFLHRRSRGGGRSEPLAGRAAALHHEPEGDAADGRRAPVHQHADLAGRVHRRRDRRDAVGLQPEDLRGRHNDDDRALEPARGGVLVRRRPARTSGSCWGPATAT